MIFGYETVVGIITIILGVISIKFTFNAYRKLSSQNLLSYIHYIFFSMISLILFSLWHTLREALELKEIYGPIIEMPEYIFVSLTYLSFFLGAISIFKMSKIFGFKENISNSSKNKIKT